MSSKELEIKLEKELDDCKNMLEPIITQCSNVFIVGHNIPPAYGPDFDSIGACVGLQAIASAFGKESYIIVSELSGEDLKIEPGVKKIIEDQKENFYGITKKGIEPLLDQHSILLVADTSKSYMITVGDMLNRFDKVVVLDHHLQDQNSIATPYQYISNEISSASEIVASLLEKMNIPYSDDVATCLLAGISLDTKRFEINTTSRTHEVAKMLIYHGANNKYVNDLFLEEFADYCRMNDFIINGTIIKKYSDSIVPYQVSFTMNRTKPKQIYDKEFYAKVADKMLTFKGIDASFVLGYLDYDTVHISARGGEKVNVGRIMRKMQGKGGGEFHRGGSIITTEDIFPVESELMEKVKLGFSDEVDVIEEPPTVKIKK